jgi:hypothetical protein
MLIIRKSSRVKYEWMTTLEGVPEEILEIILEAIRDDLDCEGCILLHPTPIISLVRLCPWKLKKYLLETQAGKTVRIIESHSLRRSEIISHR